MTVQTGTAAPEFKLYDHQKEAFRLSDYRGDKNVLLLFFPGAFTSVCTTELNQVNNSLPDFGGDTQVAGISTDSPFVLAEFSNVHGFTFPLLSDHDGDVSAAYGAKYDHDFTPMKLDRISKRSAFVIDKEGIVRYAEVLDNAGEMPDFDAIRAVLNDLS
ncbi:MAG: redoxin domain-containing protein [Rhodothermales bacterium]|nr:redoxin domain-containing protein [Rhodothermales bacterium]